MKYLKTFESFSANESRIYGIEILPQEAWYDQKFEIVCDFFGFAGYDLNYLKARVYFEY